MIGAHEIHRACRSEDAGLLSELARQDPASVLYHLDVAMRGSREGRRVPWSLVEGTRTTAELEHESWLCRRDAVLRERERGAARAADLRTLRAAYGAGELFLVLGAGVSMAAGMPDWRGLVDGVLGLSLSWREGLIEAARAKRMGRIGNSVRILATEEDVERYARDLLAVPPRTRAAIEQTRAALAEAGGYTDETLVRATSLAHDALGDEFDKVVRQVLYARPLYRTEIHPAIARLVRPPAAGAEQTARVSMIVTYNFDSLLDVAISEAGYGVCLYVSQNGETQTGELAGPQKPVAVDIWHVHGYLPSSEMRDFGGGPKLIDLRGIDLVFSAHQFELQYGANSTFTRLLHQWALVDRPGLIVGSSLSDSYAVGELRAAHERRPGWRHYCVMKRPSEDRLVVDDETRFRSLGLRVVWVDDYDDIPALLDQIRDPLSLESGDEGETARLRLDDQIEERALPDFDGRHELPRRTFKVA